MNETTIADAVANAVETTSAPADNGAAPVETTSAPADNGAAPVKTGKAKAKAKKGEGKGEAKAKRRGNLAAREGSVSPVRRDYFGAKSGSAASAINAACVALGKRGETFSPAEVHEQAGSAGRANVAATRQHCVWLLERGYLTLRDGAYALSKEGRKAAGLKAAKGATAESDESDE